MIREPRDLELVARVKRELDNRPGWRCKVECFNRGEADMLGTLIATLYGPKYRERVILTWMVFVTPEARRG